MGLYPYGLVLILGGVIGGMEILGERWSAGCRRIGVAEL